MEKLKERIRGHWLVLSIILAVFLVSPIAWQAFAGNNGNGPTGTGDVPGANKWHIQRQDNLIIGHDTLQRLFYPFEMRTSATGDLVVEVDAVCAVGIKDVDFLSGPFSFDFDGAIGKVEVAVFLDGNYREPLAPGWVDFCNRSVFELAKYFDPCVQAECSYDEAYNTNRQVCARPDPDFNNNGCRHRTDTGLVGDHGCPICVRCRDDGEEIPWEVTCGDVFKASLDTFSTAAGFKWYAINVGNGTHKIEVAARLTGIPIHLGGFVFGAVKERNLLVFTQTTLQETGPAPEPIVR